MADTGLYINWAGVVTQPFGLQGILCEHDVILYT